MSTTQHFDPCGFAGERDLLEIVKLMNDCRVADDADSRVTVTELREDFADPTFDVTHDLRLWREDSGKLVAVAQLWRQTPEDIFVSHLNFSIATHLEAATLAEEILAWAEQRLLGLAKDLAVPVLLHSGCRDGLESRKVLLQNLGFQPERSFWRLTRTLTAPIPKRDLPSGWNLRTVTASDAEGWVEMFNQTFVDHWNHTPVTLKEFRHWITRNDYDVNLDLVVETPEGQTVAFAYSEIDFERNARLSIQEGHICLLGTRRGYRRLGLAKALLAESLRRLQLLGMTTVTIGVDAQNPLGAVQLYESIGFEHCRSSTVYVKKVQMGPLLQKPETR
ncbi:MAG: GNAT family N-acetyltransferase [Leptolyngbyaceae cyanobacterium]